MDNLSHALASLAAGELLHRSLPRESTTEDQSLRQKLILFTAAAAGNFPDLDLVLYPLLQKPLGYLLHHRGHSHTLAGVGLEFALLFLIVYGLWPSARRLLKNEKLARVGFAAAAAMGFALHLSMDWLNSYGVHPFYPIDRHWYYGDLVFIVEPTFWIAFGVPVAFLTRRWWLRYPLLLIVLGLPTFVSVTRDLIPLSSLIVLLAVAGLLAWLQSREFENGRRALLAAWAVSLSFVAVQGFARTKAREVLRDRLRSLDSSVQVFDTALTASPANPACWSFTTIERTKADFKNSTYELRAGFLSIRPDLINVENCPRLAATDRPVKQIGFGVLQTDLRVAELKTLQNQAKADCHLKAWLRFARIPLVTPEAATDMRFSSTPRGNFSTLHFKDFTQTPCSPWIPGWIPPRAADLLKTESRLTNEDK